MFKNILLVLVAQAVIISGATVRRLVKYPDLSLSLDGGATTLQTGPCDSEADTLVDCAIRNGFSQSQFESCLECVDNQAPSSGGFDSCSSAFDFACSAPRQCSQCGQCSSQYSSLIVCNFEDQGCPSHNCGGNGGGSGGDGGSCPGGSFNACFDVCQSSCL